MSRYCTTVSMIEVDRSRQFCGQDPYHWVYLRKYHWPVESSLWVLIWGNPNSAPVILWVKRLGCGSRLKPSSTYRSDVMFFLLVMPLVHHRCSGRLNCWRGGVASSLGIGSCSVRWILHRRAWGGRLWFCFRGGYLWSICRGRSRIFWRGLWRRRGCLGPVWFWEGGGWANRPSFRARSIWHL